MLDTELIPARTDAGPRLMIVLHGLGDSMEGIDGFPKSCGCRQLNAICWSTRPTNTMAASHGTICTRIREPASSAAESCCLNCWTALAKKNSRANRPWRLSQGCLLSLEIGARYPHRLAGIVGISGYAHEPEMALWSVATGPGTNISDDAWDARPSHSS